MQPVVDELRRRMKEGQGQQNGDRTIAGTTGPGRAEVKVETVAESFASYRAAVIPATASEVQVEECRRAFYAGAYFLLMNVAYHIGDASTSEDEGVAALERLQAELETFAATQTAQPPALIVPDMQYTTADAAEFRPLLQDLGGRIGSALPAGWGFTLLLFQFGEGGSLFYIANADRADVLATMREFITRQTQ
jgi:hypothetical protein